LGGDDLDVSLSLSGVGGVLTAGCPELEKFRKAFQVLNVDLRKVLTHGGKSALGNLEIPTP
jgi:hypothetical protein